MVETDVEAQRVELRKQLADVLDRLHALGLGPYDPTPLPPSAPLRDLYARFKALAALTSRGAELEDALIAVVVEVCDVCERAMKKAGVEKRKRVTVLNAVDSHLDRDLR